MKTSLASIIAMIAIAIATLAIATNAIHCSCLATEAMDSGFPNELERDVPPPSSLEIVEHLEETNHVKIVERFVNI